MLGITSALAAEFVTGVGLREQWLDAPAPILFSFAIIAIASYIPILKGFTRCVAFTGVSWSVATICALSFFVGTLLAESAVHSFCHTMHYTSCHYTLVLCLAATRASSYTC